MRSGPERAVLVAVGAGILLIAMGAAGAFDEALPGRPLGFNRFQTPEIGVDRRMSQRFFMIEPNLSGVDIRPVAIGPVQGKVQLELRAIRDDSAVVVRGTEVSAEDLVRADTYRFNFDPILDSRGHSYRLDILSSPESPAGGVALWATKGPRFNDGYLSVNGLERYANLAYRPYVPRPPRRNVIPFALVALAVSWIALIVLLRELAS